MNYKENFLKLLKIAEENGWKIPRQVEYIIEETEEICFEVGDTFMQKEPRMKYSGWKVIHQNTQYSINDIVIDWKETEISFTKALAKASQDFEITSCAKSPMSVMQSWVLKPVGERLDWLLEIYEHLWKQPLVLS